MTETMEQVDEPETETVPETPETGDATEDEPDTGDVENAEPEPEPEPEQAVSQEEMERTLKKVDQAATTYRNRVSTLLGEQANDLMPCPLCSDGIMGHLYPVEWITPSSELQARLIDVLKTPNEPDYMGAPNARKCGTCDGWGKVKSGSRVAGKTLVQCPTCGGNGYQGQGAPVTNGAPTGDVIELHPPEDEAPLVSGDADIWGSPRLLDDGQENPNYGKMPQYKNPALP